MFDDRFPGSGRAAGRTERLSGYPNDPMIKGQPPLTPGSDICRLYREYTKRSYAVKVLTRKRDGVERTPAKTDGGLMARPELQQLYQELLSCRFAFIASRTHHIHDVYSAVHAQFPELCDNKYLCREYCSQGHNQPEWQHVTRRVLEALKCSRGDVSRSTRSRHWIFSDGDSVPEPSDGDEPSPDRVLLKTYRILRDTTLARRIKTLYQDKCQICGQRIDLRGGRGYSEAHHIQPLGTPHNGPDVAQNILALCPNHHAMCDYGAIRLNLTDLRLRPGHAVEQRYVDYHNDVIARFR